MVVEVPDEPRRVDGGGLDAPEVRDTSFDAQTESQPELSKGEQAQLPGVFSAADRDVLRLARVVHALQREWKSKKSRCDDATAELETMMDAIGISKFGPMDGVEVHFTRGKRKIELTVVVGDEL